MAWTGGLAALVKEVLKLDPFCGAAFIFRSKRADRINILIATARWAAGRSRLRAAPTAAQEQISPTSGSDQYVSRFSACQ